MRKKIQSLVLALACLTLSASLARAQGEVVRDEVTVRGRVEAVDVGQRTVRVRGDSGNVVTLDVPQSATRLNEVKVGDIVTVTYSDRVSVRPKPAGEPPVDRTVAKTTTAAPTDLPGASKSAQRIQTVTITGWDPATGLLTFTGPTGTAYQRHVVESTEANILAGLKVGDRVDVTRTEAVSVSLQVSATPASTPAPAAAMISDDLKNRLTFSALWGVDNQYSGKVIKEASGQTTTGVPINLHETSYDDVYGRMSLFKLGVGYRTTPRSEVALNFAISRSSAQNVQIGTVGSGIPLNVHFDDFNYWGLEAGQRWFFMRTRFTPYVGYLLGANRHGDIRGTFVDIQPGTTLPGYAAQDGKFFEKSWAFSFGPTGGVLVGLGPVEAFAEVQFRWMGGLSDVDWLVEEGLKDINSESSRWSLPAIFGVRFRF